VHEVHRPAVTDRLWYRQRLRLLPHDAFVRFDSQVQLQLPIDPVHPLVIPAVAFHVAQIQEAQAKFPVALAVRKPNQVIDDLGIFRGQPWLVAMAGDADPEGQARLLDTDSARIYGLLRHLSLSRWLHHFFHGFLEDLSLQALFGVHLLEAVIFFLQLTQTGHQ
jgi:hypothetical protein